MKITTLAIGGLLSLGAYAPGAKAQFAGKLVYEIDRPDSKLVMTYYQNGTSGQSDGYSILLKAGVPDSSTMHLQDTILWDFAKATETHLHPSNQFAVITQYMGNMEAAMMASQMKGKASLSVTSLGADTANGYHCTHYVITSTSQLGTSKRDVWITQDLGPAPTVWVIASYTYYTPGYPHMVQLANAGANGIVVRSVSSYTHMGVTSVMNLVSADTKTRLRASMFSVPSHYTVIDRSGIAPTPTGKLGVEPPTTTKPALQPKN